MAKFDSMESMVRAAVGTRVHSMITEERRANVGTHSFGVSFSFDRYVDPNSSFMMALIRLIVAQCLNVSNATLAPQLNAVTDSARD